MKGALGALAADELCPAAGSQGCSLRARGNQNMRIAAAIRTSGEGGRSTRDLGEAFLSQDCESAFARGAVYHPSRRRHRSSNDCCFTQRASASSRLRTYAVRFVKRWCRALWIDSDRRRAISAALAGASQPRAFQRREYRQWPPGASPADVLCPAPTCRPIGPRHLSAKRDQRQKDQGADEAMQGPLR